MLSIQHLLCSPRHQPPAKVLGRMILERVSWRVACPNHGRFHLLTVARKGSCGPTKKLILLRTQSLILCSKWELRRNVLSHLVSEALIFFFFLESVCRVYDSQPKRRMEVTKDFYNLNLLAKLIGFSARSCLVCSLLLLLKQSLCGFPLNRCHPRTGLLPST